MTTVEVSLPDEVNDVLESMNISKAEVILSALQSYLSKRKHQLDELLKEGYQSEHQENEMLLQEFKSVDLSNWDDY